MSTISLLMPQIGLGCWKIPKEICSDLIYTAIKDANVRHLDCACDYGNEVEVGLGIQRAITEGIVKREDLWITSKLWNTYHEPKYVEPAIQKSLKDLQCDYIDLYLIHFPIAQKFVEFDSRYPPEWIYDPSSSNPKIEQIKVPYIETWRAMEQLKIKGLTKHIGCCNINVQMLSELKNEKLPCEVLQIELHPYLTQTSLVEWCQSNQIYVTAFSPLGSPSYVVFGMDQDLDVGLLNDSDIAKIGAKYNKSNAQVILRWHLQRNYAIIPKSNSIARIKENNDIYDFVLNEDEMKFISSFNRNARFNDPGEFCKGMGGSIPIYA